MAQVYTTNSTDRTDLGVMANFSPFTQGTILGWINPDALSSDNSIFTSRLSGDTGFNIM